MQTNSEQLQQNLENYENDILNLKNFVREKRISIENRFWKFNIILDISNGNKYVAKSTNKIIKEYPRTNIIQFYREINIISKLYHPLILNFFGYSLTNFNNKPKIVVAFECISDNFSPLFSKDNDPSNWTYTNKLIITYGIASAMAYLHSHDIIHRNLIPESILLFDSLVPVLTGFDYAIEIPKNNCVNEIKYRGEFRYLAPEVLINLKYSKSSDVYSFSFLIYQVFTNKYPFQKFKSKFFVSDILNDKRRPQFEEPICEACKNLIERCWSHDPQMRPTFDQIVNELKTNPEFISDEIDEEEYRSFIKITEEEKSSFNDEKKERKLDEILKIEKPIVNFSNTDNSVIDFDISKFKIQSIYNENLEYKTNEIYYIDSEKMKEYEGKDISELLDYEKKYLHKFYAQVYLKEFKDFYKNEIINFNRKLSIISKLNHPAILNLIGFSLIDFDNQPKAVIVTEYCKETLKSVCFSFLYGFF